MSLDSNDRSLIATLIKHFDKESIIGSSADKSPVILFNLLHNMVSYCTKHYNAGNKGYENKIKVLNGLLYKLMRSCPDVCVYTDRYFTRERKTITPVISAGDDRVFFDNLYRAREFTGPHQVINLNGSIIDPDNVIESYTWINLKSLPVDATPNFTIHSTITNPKDLLSEAVINGFDEFEFILTAIDIYGNTYSDSVIMTLCNKAFFPTIQFLDEDGEFSNAPSNIDPKDEFRTKIIQLPRDSMTFKCFINIDNCNLISRYQWGIRNRDITMDRTDGDTVTLSNFVPGRTFLYVILFDSDNQILSRNQIFLDIIDQPPIVDAGDTVYTYDGTADLSGTANDPEGGDLNIEWSLISGESSHVEIENFDRLFTRVTGLNQDNEIYSFQLKAEDNVGNIATDIVEVHSRSMPTINAGVNSNLRLPKDDILLSATANDPYHLFYHYEWSLVSGPDRSPVINNINTLNPTVSGFTLVGDYNFKISAFNSNGNIIATDTVVIIVLPDPIPVPPPVVNAPPIVDAGDNIVTYNGIAQLQGVAGDVDSDSLTYKWTVISGNTDSLTIHSPSSLLTTISGMGYEIYGFQLEVSDGDGNIVTDTVEINSRFPVPVSIIYTSNRLEVGQYLLVLQSNIEDPDRYVDRVDWKITNNIFGHDLNILKSHNNNIEITGFEVHESQRGESLFTVELSIYDSENALINHDIVEFHA